MRLLKIVLLTLLCSVGSALATTSSTDMEMIIALKKRVLNGEIDAVIELSRYELDQSHFLYSPDNAIQRLRGAARDGVDDAAQILFEQYSDPQNPWFSGSRAWFYYQLLSESMTIAPDRLQFLSFFSGNIDSQAINAVLATPPPLSFHQHLSRYWIYSQAELPHYDLGKALNHLIYAQQTGIDLSLLISELTPRVKGPSLNNRPFFDLNKAQVDGHMKSIDAKTYQHPDYYLYATDTSHIAVTFDESSQPAEIVYLMPTGTTSFTQLISALDARMGTHERQNAKSLVWRQTGLHVVLDRSDGEQAQLRYTRL